MRLRKDPPWRLLLPFFGSALFITGVWVLEIDLGVNDLWKNASADAWLSASEVSALDSKDEQLKVDAPAAAVEARATAPDPAVAAPRPAASKLTHDWEERCLADTFNRPEPVVKSATSNKFLEVTFLNQPQSTGSLRTPPKCTAKDDWRSDSTGRPIAMPTSLMLERAVEVGHPHNGILDFSYRIPPQPCTRPVPKTMHFIWFCRPLLNKIALRIAQFAALNPEWQVMLLIDTPLQDREIEALLAPEATNRKAGPVIVHFLKAYANDFRNMDILKMIRGFSKDPRHLHVCAGMSDVARMELMYKFGGIYMDTDFIPNRPFDDYGDLFRWPFVSHKVCGVNIINSIIGMDRGSGFLNFAMDAYRQNCLEFKNCMPEGGAGPPFLAMAILRYNSSDIMLIGQQYFHDSKQQIVSHLTENSWGQR